MRELLEPSSASSLLSKYILPGGRATIAKQPHSRRVIKVPAKDYQPTKAELEEPISISTQGMPLDKAVKRLLRPVEVQEIPADQYTEQRKRGKAAK